VSLQGDFGLRDNFFDLLVAGIQLLFLGLGSRQNLVDRLRLVYLAGRYKNNSSYFGIH